MSISALMLSLAGVGAFLLPPQVSNAITSVSADDTHVRITLTIDRDVIAPGEALQFSASRRVISDGQFKFPQGNSQPLVYLYLKTPDGKLIMRAGDGGAPNGRRPFGVNDYRRPLTLKKDQGSGLSFGALQLVAPSPDWWDPDTFDAIRPNLRTVGEYEVWMRFSIPAVPGAPAEAWQGTLETDRIRFVVREIPVSERRMEATAEQIAHIEAYVAEIDALLSNRGVRPDKPAAVEMPELMATVDRVRWALERTENEGFALYTVAMLKTHQPKDDKQTYPRWWGNLSYFVMRRAYSQYDGDSSLRIVGPYLDEFIPIALEETERRLEGRAVWSGGYEGLLLDYLNYKPESPIRQRLDFLAQQYAKVPPGAPNGDRQIRHRLSVAWGMLLSLEIIHDGMTVSEVTDLLGEPTTRVAGHVSWNYETGSRAKEYGIDGKVSSNGERETIEFTNVDRWKH